MVSRCYSPHVTTDAEPIKIASPSLYMVHPEGGEPVAVRATSFDHARDQLAKLGIDLTACVVTNINSDGTKLAIRRGGKVIDVPIVEPVA